MAHVLHPAVEFIVTAEDRVELHDPRTGLRVALEDIQPPFFEDGSTRTLSGELASICEELGLTSLSIDSLGLKNRHRALRQRLHLAEQRQRLTELIAFAVSRVPFYRARKGAYERPVDKDVPAADLPVLTKATLRTEFDRLMAEDVAIREELAAGSLELVSTSGTTEDRVQAMADMTLERVPSEFEEIWQLPPLSSTPRTAVLTSPTCMGPMGCNVEVLSRAKRLKQDYTLFVPLGADLFSIGEDAVKRALEELHEFSPDFLLVNPVYAHWLARQSFKLGLPLPRVRLILSSYQYASRIQRRALETFYGAPVRSMYSATELGGCQIGLECGAGLLHTRDDHSLVEIVGPDGRPRDRGLGSVVVTTLAARVMPLVRYEVGDLAEFCITDCDCPMAAWSCFVFHGRSNEVLKLDGRVITTRALDEAVANCPGVDFYTCYQVDRHSIELEVIPAEGVIPKGREITTTLQQHLPGVKILLRTTRRLEPVASLKYPLVRPGGT